MLLDTLRYLNSKKPMISSGKLTFFTYQPLKSQFSLSKTYARQGGFIVGVAPVLVFFTLSEHRLIIFYDEFCFFQESQGKALFFQPLGRPVYCCCALGGSRRLLASILFFCNSLKENLIFRPFGVSWPWLWPWPWALALTLALALALALAPGRAGLLLLCPPAGASLLLFFVQAIY